VKCFALHYFLLFGAWSVFAAYFPLLLKTMGFSTPQVGVLQGYGQFAAMVGGLALGWLADRLGRRRGVLAAAAAGFIVALALLGTVSAFWTAAAIIAVGSFLGGARIPLADALASGELADPVHQYGRVRAMGSVGWIVVLLAVWAFDLVREDSARSILTAIVAAMAAYWLSILFLPDRRRQRAVHEADPPGAGLDRAFWLYMAVVFLAAMGMSSHYAFFSLYLKEVIGLESIAWVWTIGALVEMPMIFFGGRVIKRFSLVGMLIVSLAAVSIRLGVYALWPNLWAVVAVQPLHAFTFGMIHIATIEFIRRKVDPSRRGLALAVYVACQRGLAGLIGSACGGYVIKYLGGYRAMFGIYAVWPLAGLLLVVLARKRLAHAAGNLPTLP